MIFGIANQVFGNLRIAILALIFFFVVGLILLPMVNDRKAIEDVKKFDLSNS
jgi:MFS-type transporter involved in bile tolerance (Atg22 family)